MSRSASTSPSTPFGGPRRPRRSAERGLTGARAKLALRRLDRRRLLALGAAAVVALITFSTVSEAQHRSAALGQTQWVAVARVDASAGTTLTSAEIELIARPRQFVPGGAIADEAIGAVLTADIAAGEVVVGNRIGAGNSPLAADERAVTVPLPLAPPLIDVGDHVELVGLQVVDVAGSAAPTISAVLITNGRVLAVGDEAVTVATPDHAALEVLRFLAAGSVELVVTPER